MSADRWPGRRLVLAGAVAALLLGAASVLALAATDAFRGPSGAHWRVPGARCNAPALPGQAVDVTVGDMGPGMMGGSPGRHGMGMLRLVARPGVVSGGVVSLQVFNAGAMTHEVVVLPLSPGQGLGERPTGPDGKIDEAGSLGEASRTCGAGAGDGIAPGAMGWTTLALNPGRYELVCNVPGHYAAGMYAELDVER
ncbi:hypothetical protein AB0A71_39810 [Kitasatospora aureofaciens]|uniref:hypothetical protein n=1 Tax=Kitasatospora aureofaciens TaxID=1894 RepID=UPI00340C5E4E